MNFRCNLKMLLAISGLIGSVSIFAAPFTTDKTIASSQSNALQGLYFQHQDWELACDNTGTCRAAGYQSDDDFEQPMSMLLTRQAGAKTAVQGQLQIQEDITQATLFLNGRVLQQLNFHERISNLSAASVQKLLAQARKHVVIELKHAQQRWKLSGAGMSAVLLKMDEFQKRGGTFSALVNKGTANESQVLAPQAQFSVKQIKTATQPYLTLQPNHPQYANLHQRLMAARPKQKQADVFCEGIYTENKVEPQTIELYALSNHKVLATTLCWRGAYNVGYGAWVLDRSLTGKASFVTEIASDVGNGQINSAQKGRGIGDCWSTNEWIWNGQRFIQTLDRWSGMCKGLAAGGVWELDRIEAIVK